MAARDRFDHGLREDPVAAMTVAPEKPKLMPTFPVMEVFGPTVQGEGALAGTPTYFVRLGGCDYRCIWCDSMHAVLPEEVRAHAEKLTLHEIIGRIRQLEAGPEWVTLSGGNPALLKLGPLVAGFQGMGIRVAVETQGSRWRDWLGFVNCLTISPKPPSSGMADLVAKDLDGFMYAASAARGQRQRDALKVVVFDDADLEFAADVFHRFPSWPRYLSCGTDVGEPITTLTERYRWLLGRVAHDKRFAQARAFPQLHVVAWGHVKGV
jgi:7-carboxy-7-deazaguanine synthase